MRVCKFTSLIIISFLVFLIFPGQLLFTSVYAEDYLEKPTNNDIDADAQAQAQIQSQTKDSESDSSTDNALARLLIVPLDNRPANTYYPQKIGQAGGLEIILPPSHLIHHETSFTTLDQLSDWIFENSDDVDGFIIAADMITDGGLVNSRTNKQTSEKALQQLEIIKKLKNYYPTKPVYVYDTIQRLAPTVLQDGSIEKYNLIRDWAITYDKVIHLNDTDLANQLHELEAKIGPELIDEYMQIRTRNNLVNSTLIDWTKEGYIDFLVLGQDDASLAGLHRKEQESLNKKINAYNIHHKVYMFDGADEVDVILLSRFLANLNNYQTTFNIHYLGIDGAKWTSPFDHYSLQTNIEKHIIAAGGIVASPFQQADIELYVNTPDTLHGNSTFTSLDPLLKKNAEVTQAVAEINNQIRNGKHVVFIDVEAVNKANPAYGDAIINDIGITNLLSYSAFNTAGNAVGIAIGHANARFLYIEKGEHIPEWDEHAAKGHVEFLLNSIAADYLYRTKIEPKTQWYVRYMGSNAWDIGSQKNAILNYTREQFYKEFDFLHSNVKYRHVFLTKKGENISTAKIENFTIQKIDLPWNRLFEVEFKFQVNFKDSF